MSAPLSPEQQRLAEDEARILNWKRWGPYLSERQWATVREDYSANGECWDYFPHDHSRSRAYRWGEDGLLGFTDRECRLCFALALWNERDPILKERLFGLTGPEGNHGEDVKECYYYLDSTPTHSYAKALYKYPQAEFPYDRLVKENRARGINGPEFELIDTGIFNEGRYFDVQAEYAKAGPDDLCIRLTLSNRGPAPATLHVLPTLWFRNIWSWGRLDGRPKPELHLEKPALIRARHHSLGEMLLAWEDAEVEALFTENETDSERLWKTANACPYVKDAFHKAVVNRQADAVNPEKHGTKAAPHFTLVLAPGEERVLRLRLVAASAAPKDFFGPSFEETFRARLAEADEFYAALPCPHISIEAQAAARQAYAGLLWSKQFYHYVVADWLEGDPGQPAPPPQRFRGRNSDWPHFYSYDILSMPDKWEYPWFAAWDLAFHMIPMATVDPAFAKNQLKLLLREWYMHPNGQIPAYEFAFGDVNPPVHAWAAWRVYKMTGERGQRDRAFLEGVFQKLLLNFTWWVNRKDAEGQNLFQGGFLGLDNIGVFDRSKPLPTGGYLQQADGTAWMGFYCLTMLSMALELAQDNPVYEDLASKFFEHFVHITDAINRLGGSGLWDETDGFYYDQLKIDGQSIPLRTRSLVGLLPLIAVEVLEEEMIQKLPGFRKRLEWFVAHRPDIAELSAMCDLNTQRCYRLLAIPSEVRLRRTLQYLLDEKEFLSPYGIRSLSRVYEKQPFVFRYNGQEYSVDYEPCESRTYLFGGNSNWRGPVWFPINYLIIEALERYHHFYGGALEVEFPTGSGQKMTLDQVANALSKRMASLFLPDDEGHRPCHGGDERYAIDPYWRNLLLFYEYFHSETGRGCGASHQTGWTALVTRNLVACQECEKLPKAGA